MKGISLTLIAALLAQIIPAPCAALEGMILKAGEIELSKIQVGAYVWMSCSGKKDRRSTLKGYVKSADEKGFTIGEGLWKESVKYQDIVTLVMGSSPGEVARLKKSLEGSSRLSKRTKTILALVGVAIVGTLAGLLAQGEALGGEE